VTTAEAPACASAASAAPVRVDTPATPHARRAAAASLAALALGHLAVDCCSGIWPVFKTVAGLDLARAGLIATVGSMSGNGLQLAFGGLADGGRRGLLLVVGVASAASVTFVPWAAGSYLLMALLVMASQIGSAAFHPSASGAATTIAPRRAGFMLGLFPSGGYVGYALSQIVFTSVYARHPRATPLIGLLPLAAAAAIAAVVPRTPPRPRGSGLRWQTVREARRALGPLFLVQVCASAVNTTLIFLLPDLLQQRAAPRFVVEGGGHFALVAGGCLALLPAGAASDRWGARRVLSAANLASGVLFLALLSSTRGSWGDLALVLAFGTLNGVNSVVAVSEGSRVLPGHASAVSALLMGLPWCIAALGPVIGGVLADPARGGTAAAALGWFALLLPCAFLAGLSFRSVRAAS
jgi:FSR family fosmidomycin resistance protein-like MFS transporter